MFTLIHYFTGAEIQNILLRIVYLRHLFSQQVFLSRSSSVINSGIKIGPKIIVDEIMLNMHLNFEATDSDDDCFMKAEDLLLLAGQKCAIAALQTKNVSIFFIIFLFIYF